MAAAGRSDGRQRWTIGGNERGELRPAENRRSSACFVKPIRKRDAVEQDGTRKIRRAAGAREPSRLRGQRIRERPPETPEMGVVVLITQRSQVQILPPLPFTQVRGLSRRREGPSCCAVLTSLLTALRPSGSALGSPGAPVPDTEGFAYLAASA